MIEAWSWVLLWQVMQQKAPGVIALVVCETVGKFWNPKNIQDVADNAPEAGKWKKSRERRFGTPLPPPGPCSALAAGAQLCEPRAATPSCPSEGSLPQPQDSAFHQLKHSAPLCRPTTRLPSRTAYLQLAMPFTFTQMPSFWQGFGSHGSLK